jgi:hypothetical protein
MNFQDLMKRMAELDRPVNENIQDECSCSQATEDDLVDECGGMMGDSQPAPKQGDSVTMNVTMNGSGAGGIRDLLNVLKDIQDGPDQSSQDHEIDMDIDTDSDGPDLLMKKNIDSMADMIDDDFANSMSGDTGPEIHGIDASIPDGNDLHREKGSYPKASGGDNAMKLKGEQTFKLPEGPLKIKLENLYNEIKRR